MYVDDYAVYTSAHTSVELVRVFNKEIRLLEEWFRFNILIINVEETKLW